MTRLGGRGERWHLKQDKDEGAEVRLITCRTWRSSCVPEHNQGIEDSGRWRRRTKRDMPTRSPIRCSDFQGYCLWILQVILRLSLMIEMTT